jgi:hypothetical protein
MLQKTKSKQVQLVRYALLIPMVFGMLVYSSCSDENNSSKQQEDINLSQYTYTIVSGEDNSEDLKEKADASNEFLKNNPEYIQWLVADYSEKTPKMQSSIHLKSEVIPDGYKIEELDTDEGDTETIVFGKIGEPSLESINTLDYEGKDEVPFSVISQIPVFPGCDKQADELAKKACFNKEISTFIVENFNSDLGKTLNLSGVVKISVYFKIDNQGNITDAKARAQHPELAEEAMRVVNMLPKMTPGMHDGKAVNVPYYLPIKFEIKE